MNNPDMKSPAPLVLLTTDTPEQCAQALLHLLATVPPEWMVAVVAHGPQGLDCLEVAQEMLRRLPFSAVSVSTGNRLDAVNEGLRYLQDASALYVLNDDARVAEGWALEMGRCLGATEVHGMGSRVMDTYPNVGIVAPCTDQSSSRAQRLDLGEREAAMGLGAYAAARLAHFQGRASAADFAEGFCLLLTRPLLDALGSALVDPDLGSWAWADLCLRAADAGHRVAVSEAVYVGRTTQVPLGHEKLGSVADRLAFYRKHPRPEREHIIAVVVAPPMRWQVLQSLRLCVRRLAPLVDGVALVLHGDLALIQQDPEYIQARRDKEWSPPDNRLIKFFQGKTTRQTEAEVVASWVQGNIADVPRRRIETTGIRAMQVEAGASPVDQRNAALAMAADMGATAVLALDYDEMIDIALHREHMARLMAHPNPLVRGYDCGLAYHWDTPTLVREDPPWGHGGTYSGGPHAVRLMRLRGDRAPQILQGAGAGAVPDVGPAGQRAAAITARRFRFSRASDRANLSSLGTTEGMRLSAYTGDTRTGLHMLLYEREQPEDVARWLDDVHGLVDHTVLVWTGPWAEADKAWQDTGWGGVQEHLDGDSWPATGPGRALAWVAHLHGCAWVHEPLDDNIAQARNAGIQALHDRGGLRWAMFVDPDEWLGDPLADGVALRNMASSDRWGWLMQVANYRNGKEAPTISDSVRISRLDGQGIMRMDGRVHEGFQRAIHTLQGRSIHPRLVYAPFVLQHRGMAFDDARMDAKLTHYEHLLRLELADSPHSPGAWVSLGWQYFNDGHQEQGLECYHRAMACAGNSYLPFKELAYHHLRVARALLDECDDRLVDSHQFHGLLQTMRNWMGQYAPPHPVIPRLETRAPLALPAWTPPAIPGASGYDNE